MLLCVKVISVWWQSFSVRFVVIAGDVSPIDVISHIPIVCEDNKIPYAYVPSRLVSNSAFSSLWMNLIFTLLQQYFVV